MDSDLSSLAVYQGFGELRKLNCKDFGPHETLLFSQGAYPSLGTNSHLRWFQSCRLCQQSPSQSTSRLAETSRSSDSTVAMHGRSNKRGTVVRSRVLNAGDSRSSVTSRFLVSLVGEGVVQHCVPMEAFLRAKELGSSLRRRNTSTVG